MFVNILCVFGVHHFVYQYQSILLRLQQNSLSICSRNLCKSWENNFLNNSSVMKFRIICFVMLVQQNSCMKHMDNKLGEYLTKLIRIKECCNRINDRCDSYVRFVSIQEDAIHIQSRIVCGILQTIRNSNHVSTCYFINGCCTIQTSTNWILQLTKKLTLLNQRTHLAFALLQ